MWDDIVIGSGNKGNSSIKVFDMDNGAYISQNNASYWISGALFGFGITVFKNTEEGKKLQKMLSAPCGVKELETFLDDIVLKRGDPDLIKRRVKGMVNGAFNAGRADKMSQIREVLGIV